MSPSVSAAFNHRRRHSHRQSNHPFIARSEITTMAPFGPDFKFAWGQPRAPLLELHLLLLYIYFLESTVSNALCVALNSPAFSSFNND